MSNKKITHYSILPILKTLALIFIIFGKKSNGKSYAAKHYVIEDYLKTGKRFIYLRRWKDEATQSNVEQYFHDVDVYKLTEGRYNCICCFRRKIYFANYNTETMKVVKGEQIGYYAILSQEQNLSSGSFLDVGNILFEEFMSRTMYIAKEAEKLMFFYNTIDRNRKTTKLFLIGNTISRACPYLIDWDLLPIVKTIKQGEIVTKEIKDTDGNSYNMSIEFCVGSDGGSALNIGKSSGSISKGEWLSEPQPKLPESYNNYKCYFRFVMEKTGFRYLIELLTDGNNIFWFVRPKNSEIKEGTLVISDQVKIDRNYYLTLKEAINSINEYNPRLANLLLTFRPGNTFYCSDIIGTDFNILNLI